MPESAQKILKELTDVGLLSPEQATKYDSEIASGAERLMERLVEDGVVTEYQAKKFLAGEASDIAFGDYLVIRELGQGGMGTVLLARHRRMDREVAIKILPVTALGSEAAVARFYQEVKVAAQLKHSNIVHAYDAGDHRGFHYLVMEYVQGHDLAKVLQQLGPVPAAMAVDYIIQAASGLEYAHSKGVVHRDVKPSNLLLDDEGTIKVLDMGLARLGNSGETSLQLTTTGQVMGTVDYMSPEQAEDTREADHRSDIYSLGCTLYRLIVGTGPFTRDTVVKTILAHRESEIPSLEPLEDPSVAQLNPIFQRMVAKKPEERYQSISELLQDLRSASGEVTFSSLGKSPSMVPPEDVTIPPQKTLLGDSPTMAPASASTAPSSSESLGTSPLGPVPVPPPSDVQYAVSNVSSGAVDASGKPLYGPVDYPQYAIPLKEHRGTSLLAFGMLSILMSACYVGSVVGLVIWIFAGSDLEEMDNNRRDSEGRTITRAAKICGQIATIIGGIWLAFSLLRFLIDG
jgi:serine/threonine protein kinase